MPAIIPSPSSRYLTSFSNTLLYCRCVNWSSLQVVRLYVQAIFTYPWDGIRDLNNYPADFEALALSTKGGQEEYLTEETFTQ